MTTSSSKLRRRILKQRGVELAKHTRTPTTYDDIPASYHKTRAMKYIELKFSDKLERLIFTGTERETAKRLGVDYSTVSKWRKIIRDAKEAEFWSQFKERR